MSQQVSLYRKYRPRTFADYKGDFIHAAVKRFSDPSKRPQVVLLHGVHGCGKTTAARIFAGYYLCETPLDDGMPCGKCGGCMQILDLIETGEDDSANESIQEINGSVVNKVEDIRRIMSESMSTLPTFSKYKVFIIDECHRITPEAQNALLKILEDIPSYLIIIFATTEPEKLLPTIRSRCQLEVEVRKQTVKGMTDILMKIAKAEGYTVGMEALKLIARKGGRIPRDCINLLEDIANTYDGQITSANVLERVGEVDTEIYFKFIKAAHTGLVDVMTFISEFSEGDTSYQKFVSGLSRFVLEAVYARFAILSEMDAKYKKTLNELFKMYKVDEFHILLKLVDEAAHRSNLDIGSTDLALSVLALRIGDIVKVQEAVSGDSVQTQATKENSEGAKKFVERETAQRFEKKTDSPSNLTDLDEFMAGLGAVRYDT